MDWSKVSRSQWMVTGGTAAAVIGTLLLAWYSFSLGPLGSIDVSAWDTNFIGKLAVLGSLVMLAGAVLLFVPNPPELPVPLPMAAARGERASQRSWPCSSSSTITATRPSGSG